MPLDKLTKSANVWEGDESNLVSPETGLTTYAWKYRGVTVRKRNVLSFIWHGLRSVLLTFHVGSIERPSIRIYLRYFLI